MPLEGILSYKLVYLICLVKFYLVHSEPSLLSPLPPHLWMVGAGEILDEEGKKTMWMEEGGVQERYWMERGGSVDGGGVQERCCMERGGI